MSLLDQFNQANHHATTSVIKLAGMFPARSTGSLTRTLQEMQTGAHTRFGLPGLLVAGLLRLIAGLVIGCVLAVGLLWLTLGSFVLITSKTWLWGYPGNTLDGLGLGLLTAVVNAVMTLLALGYLYHLLMPRDERDVFGRAAFSNDRDMAARAGLSSGEEARHG